MTGDQIAPRDSVGIRPSMAVVIPVFNGSATLVDCLSSVFFQSIPPAQVIAVDDGSADGSPELIEQLFPRVTVIRLPRNSGVGYARNVGVGAANTDLVAFLDQDDLWLPARCERLTDHFIAHPASDAVVTSVHVFADLADRAALSSHRFLPWIEHWVPAGGAGALALALDAGGADLPVTNLSLTRLLNWTVAVTTTYAIRRSAYLAVGGCATWLRSADDWVLLQALASYGQVDQIDDKSVLYRVHSSNTSIDTDWGVPLLAAAAAVRNGRALVSKEGSRDVSTVGRLSDSGFLMDLLVGLARSQTPRASGDLLALVTLLATDRTDVRRLGRALLRARLGTAARGIARRRR